MSITVEGQPVAGFMEDVLSLAAADPECFGLERIASDPNFTFEEVAQVLNQGSPLDRVLDESDRDYFVSRGLMTRDEFLVAASILASPELRNRTHFSVSPGLAREVISMRRESRCEELEDRIRNHEPTFLDHFVGVSFFLNQGNPFILATTMVSQAESFGDFAEYVRLGCVYLQR